MRWTACAGRPLYITQHQVWRCVLGAPITSDEVEELGVVKTILDLRIKACMATPQRRAENRVEKHVPRCHEPVRDDARTCCDDFFGRIEFLLEDGGPWTLTP